MFLSHSVFISHFKRYCNQKVCNVFYSFHRLQNTKSSSHWKVMLWIVFCFYLWTVNFGLDCVNWPHSNSSHLVLLMLSAQHPLQLSDLFQIVKCVCSWNRPSRPWCAWPLSLWNLTFRELRWLLHEIWSWVCVCKNVPVKFSMLHLSLVKIQKHISIETFESLEPSLQSSVRLCKKFSLHDKMCIHIFCHASWLDIILVPNRNIWKKIWIDCY